MDLLQDKWSPALYLEKTLLLVQSLIASPMLVSPADAVNPAAAEMFLTNPTLFQKTARFKCIQNHTSFFMLFLFVLILCVSLFTAESGLSDTQRPARRHLTLLHSGSGSRHF